MSDAECPYCLGDVEINHDDGYGYDEYKTYKQECEHCGRTFAFTTMISLDYDTSQAKCLNGGEHRYEKEWIVPARYARMRCVDCGDEQPLSPNA